ncbi:MAG: Omp28-related outer membrane protein, partial [Bacteroidia bacterium]
NEGNNPVVILGLYTTFPKSLTFPFSGYEDMTSETAQLIGTNIYNFSNQLPAGGVNRKLYSGESSENIPFSIWQNKSESFGDEKAIVNVDLKKEQKDDSTFIFTCKSTFTSSPEEKPFLTLFLTEDDITHPQKNTSGTDSAYVHSHVVRYEITPYNGSPMEFDGSDAAQKGSEFEVVWQVQIPENIDQNKASLVALINYNADNNKEVIQCREIHLK